MSTVTNVAALPALHAEQQPTAPAISWPDGSSTRTLTWAQYQRACWVVAAGLIELGVRPGDTVAILAGNRVEHYVADLGAVLCGAATVSLYPTLADDQLAYILADAAPSVVVVPDAATRQRVNAALRPGSGACLVTLTGDPHTGGPHEVASWSELERSGERSLAAHRPEIERRVRETRPERVLTYVYTSGTTGAPKGVTLTHANMLWALDAWERVGIFAADYRVVSYLPLAHIAERLWSMYFPLQTGGHVLCCPSPDQLVGHLRMHRPSFFMGVPRVWEKLRLAAEELIDSDRYAGRAEEIAVARAVVGEAWTCRQTNQPLSPEVAAAAARHREGVLHDLRRDLGMDRTLTPASGAAALSPDVKAFFGSLGVPLIEAYGLSETTGVAVCERSGAGALGSVGTALPGCELRIAADGEIMIKSPGNTPGYRNRDDAELFVDGWLASGDIGRLDEAGRLFVTDRKKELIVTGSGKNISPSAIEAKLAGRGLIDLVAVVGDDRPYLVALLTVRQQEVAAFAERHALAGAIGDLLADPAVLAEVQRVVDAANRQLSRPEQVKHFALIGDEWSVSSGELTPTLKLRRREVSSRYRSVIDALYETPRRMSHV